MADDRLAPAINALTGEVTALNSKLDDNAGSIAALTASNVTLGQRSKTHSWWIFGTVAGLALDVVLTIVLFGNNARLTASDARQAATTARLEISVQESCAFYSLVLGSYRPESRPPGPDRDTYERSFVRMRRSYDRLECTEPIVPPATSPPR